MRLRKLYLTNYIYKTLFLHHLEIACLGFRCAKWKLNICSLKCFFVILCSGPDIIGIWVLAHFNGSLDDHCNADYICNNRCESNKALSGWACSNSESCHGFICSASLSKSGIEKLDSLVIHINCGESFRCTTIYRWKSDNIFQVWQGFFLHKMILESLGL